MLVSPRVNEVKPLNRKRAGLGKSVVYRLEERIHLASPWEPTAAPWAEKYLVLDLLTKPLGLTS